MKLLIKIILIGVLTITNSALKAQYVHADSLLKYSKLAEQEKVFSNQARLLQLNAAQEKSFKTTNYFYAAKALIIVKNDTLSW